MLFVYFPNIQLLYYNPQIFSSLWMFKNLQNIYFVVWDCLYPIWKFLICFPFIAIYFDYKFFLIDFISQPTGFLSFFYITGIWWLAIKWQGLLHINNLMKIFSGYNKFLDIWSNCLIKLFYFYRSSDLINL